MMTFSVAHSAESGANGSVAKTPQRRVGRQRLRRKDVEHSTRRAHACRTERRDERRLIDHRAPGDVDEPRAWFHHPQPLRVQ
jgi:hypothetical protein